MRGLNLAEGGTEGLGGSNITLLELEIKVRDKIRLFTRNNKNPNYKTANRTRYTGEKPSYEREKRILCSDFIASCSNKVGFRKKKDLLSSPPPHARGPGKRGCHYKGLVCFLLSPFSPKLMGSLLRKRRKKAQTRTKQA